jgi:hypothetical protein
VVRVAFCQSPETAVVVRNVHKDFIFHNNRHNEQDVTTTLPYGPTRVPCAGASLATALAASRVRLSGPLAQIPTPPWKMTGSALALLS